MVRTVQAHCREIEGSFRLRFRASDYRARYYDSINGRFISEDPIQLAGGINYYAYVDNNPVDFADPVGLCPPAPAKRPCGVTLPKETRVRTMISTVMGEETPEALIGSKQWAVFASGPVRNLRSCEAFAQAANGTFGFDLPSVYAGGQITDDILDAEAALIAGTMLNLGHIGNAGTYRGLPQGQQMVNQALNSKLGSPICTMLRRAAYAVGMALAAPDLSPFTHWRAVVSNGNVRDLLHEGPAFRLAGTDFW